MRTSALGTLLSAVLIVAVSCDQTSGRPVTSSATATVAPSSSASRTPTPEQERSILQALASVGMRSPSVIADTKFDWLFGGSAQTSGIFSGTIDGTQTWADVHFLEPSVEGITACTGRSASGESTFTVGIKGRPQVLGGANVTGAISSAGPMYFANSQKIFVMTPDARLRDGLRSALALSVPSCIWREPETLPILPWERDITDAFQASGLELRLVGGSKFESFLGDRRDARVFTATLGTTASGAEVLYLPAPIDLRMCNSPSTPGFTKWTVRVDGKDLPGMEGSQTVYPLIGPRFFVLAWDAQSAQALAKGLGLSMPPC